jgi:hypothetical protein
MTTCSMTQGPFGEIINPFTTHPAIGAVDPIIDYPVDPELVLIINGGGRD